MSSPSSKVSTSTSLLTSGASAGCSKGGQPEVQSWAAFEKRIGAGRHVLLMWPWLRTAVRLHKRTLLKRLHQPAHPSTHTSTPAGR